MLELHTNRDKTNHTSAELESIISDIINIKKAGSLSYLMVKQPWSFS